MSKITRNGEEALYAIEGTKMLTDSSGIKRIDDLRRRYEGRSMEFRPKLAQDVRNLLLDLVREKRLYRESGDRI